MKKKLLALILALALAAGMLSGCAKAIDAQEARSGVVRVAAFYTTYYYDYETHDYLGYGSSISAGSAFGVGTTGEPTNIFVTNRHVVESDDEYYSGTITYNGEEKSVIYYTELDNVYILKDDYAYTSSSGLDTSRATPCTVLYEADSDEPDLAVLRAADTLEDRMALPLLDPDYELEVGDEVLVLGYPGTSDAYGSEDLLASVEHVTVTDGKVSILRSVTVDDAVVDTIQHTATINYGNSGGPLITSTGEVAGVNTWGFTSGNSGDTSTNNSIEIKYVTKILDSLDIDYDVRKPVSNTGLIIGIAAAAVVVLVIVIFLLVRKKKPQANTPANVTPVVAPAPEPANPIPGPVIPDDTGLRIQCVSGVFAGKRFTVGKQLRIGRDPARSNLVYPGSTPGVSGLHCLLAFQNGQLYLQDLGSTYGTFLGSGQRLAANQPVALRIGDKFSLGSSNETFIVTGRGGI